MTNSSIDINVNMRGGINVPRGMNNYGGGGISNNRNAILAQGYSGIAGSSNNNNDNRNMSSTLDRQFMYNFMNNNRNNVGEYPVGAYNSLSLDNPNNPKSPYHPNNIRGAGGAGRTRGYSRNPLLAAVQVGGNALGGNSLSNTLNTVGSGALSFMGKAGGLAIGGYLASKLGKAYIESAKPEFDKSKLYRRELMNQEGDIGRNYAKYLTKDTLVLDDQIDKRMLNKRYIDEYVGTEFSRSGNLGGEGKENMISFLTQGQNYNVTENAMSGLAEAIGDLDKLPELTNTLPYVLRNWEGNANEFVKIMTKMVINLKESGVTDPNIYEKFKELSSIKGDTRMVYDKVSNNLATNFENSIYTGNLVEGIGIDTFGSRDALLKKMGDGFTIEDIKLLIDNISKIHTKGSDTYNFAMNRMFGFKWGKIEERVNDIMEGNKGKKSPKSDRYNKLLDELTDEEKKRKTNFLQLSKDRNPLQVEVERTTRVARNAIAIYTRAQKKAMMQFREGLESVTDTLITLNDGLKDFFINLQNNKKPKTKEQIEKEEAGMRSSLNMDKDGKVITHSNLNN